MLIPVRHLVSFKFICASFCLRSIALGRFIAFRSRHSQMISWTGLGMERFPCGISGLNLGSTRYFFRISMTDIDVYGSLPSLHNSIMVMPNSKYLKPLSNAVCELTLGPSIWLVLSQSWSIHSLLLERVFAHSEVGQFDFQLTWDKQISCCYIPMNHSQLVNVLKRFSKFEDIWSFAMKESNYACAWVKTWGRPSRRTLKPTILNAGE